MLFALSLPWPQFSSFFTILSKSSLTLTHELLYCGLNFGLKSLSQQFAEYQVKWTVDTCIVHDHETQSISDGIDVADIDIDRYL